eukprot:15070901-Ditylum_brightwellii.AAC.1
MIGIFNGGLRSPKHMMTKNTHFLPSLVLQDPNSKYNKQLSVFPTCPPGCFFPHGGDPEPHIPPAGLCICWDLGI